MSPEHLLYPAIFIFSMMVIGLVFTVIEFTKLGVKSDIKQADAQSKRDARARSDESTAKDEQPARQDSNESDSPP